MVNEKLQISVRKIRNTSGLVTTKQWYTYCPVCRNPDYEIFGIFSPGTYAWFNTWAEALEVGNYHATAHYQGNVNMYIHPYYSRRN